MVAKGWYHNHETSAQRAVTRAVHAVVKYPEPAMLDRNELSKARLYLDSLSALHQRLEEGTVSYVRSQLVEQIDAEICEVLRDLPSLSLPKWSLTEFFLSRNEEDTWYKRDALSGYLVRVLARLNEAVRETAIDPGTAALAFQFIIDQAIRAIVERDYRELQVAVLANVWKGALTLAGSCIEGVLFDLASSNRQAAVAAKTAPREQDIARWTLGQLVAVCTELRLIPPGVDKLSPGLRDYRNLVHPAVEAREHLLPGEHEARIAVAILNMLHRDLS